MTPESLKRGIIEIIDNYTTIRKMYEELKEHNAYLESRISESEDLAALRARVARLEDALRDVERVLEWAEPQPRPVLIRVRRALEEK